MSFSTPMTWTVGYVVLAADMNREVRDNLTAVWDRRSAVARKTNDSTMSNTTVRVADSELKINVGAGESWCGMGTLYFGAPDAVDATFSLTVPSSGDLRLSVLRPAPTVASGTFNPETLPPVGPSTGVAIGGANATLATPSVPTWFYFDYVGTAAASGNISVNWAPGANSTIDIRLAQGSFMIANKIPTTT